MSRFAHAASGLPLVIFALAAACTQTADVPATSSDVPIVVLASSDSVSRAAVEQLVMPPLPVPDAVKPYTLRACFDVDTAGRGALISWSRSRDSTYNGRLLATLRGYRFRPARLLTGSAIRDTLCVQAMAG
jgi:hypothetical protein